MVTFGIGAEITTLTLLSVATTFRCCVQGIPPPSLHWGVLKYAGVAAGSCWVLGNFMITAAVVMGGNAVVMTQTVCAQIITGGLVGILHYGENGNTQVE